MHLEAALLSLANLVADLGPELFPKFVGRARQGTPHVDLHARTRDQSGMVDGVLVPQLQVADVELIGQFRLPDRSGAWPSRRPC